jgi:hypothetical protein
MRRTPFILIALALAALALPSDAGAGIVGLSLKPGFAFIPDGRVPGGILQADIGPLSPFVEAYRKSGVTTANLGVNLVVVRLPAPVVTPYVAGGGGIARASGNGVTKTRAMVNGLAGADVKLPGTTSLFGQIKYIYTLGGSQLAVRDVAFQAGLKIYLGL